MAGDALAQLALACLRFNIEVLSRARAGSCVHLFFESLEELVIQVPTPFPLPPLTYFTCVYPSFCPSSTTQLPLYLPSTDPPL